jgi:hypothetical protein
LPVLGQGRGCCGSWGDAVRDEADVGETLRASMPAPGRTRNGVRRLQKWGAVGRHVVGDVAGDTAEQVKSEPRGA